MNDSSESGNVTDYFQLMRKAVESGDSQDFLRRYHQKTTDRSKWPLELRSIPEVYSVMPEYCSFECQHCHEYNAHTKASVLDHFSEGDGYIYSPQYVDVFWCVACKKVYKIKGVVPELEKISQQILAAEYEDDFPF